MTLANNSTSLRYSTEASPERDRVEAWRELYGRKVLRLEVEPLPGRPFFADITLRILPGLRVASGIIQGTRDRRTRALMADNNDDLGLAINWSGSSNVSQCGREIWLGRGDAALLSCAKTGTFTRPDRTGYVGLRVAHSVLAALVPNVDDSVMRLIARDNDALRLLMSYVETLDDAAAMATPELRHSVVAHIHDLIALTIGATRDAAAVALGRGVRAARLRAIKTDVRNNLMNPELSIGVVARRHRLTPRYIQMLFSAEGATYSDFVLGRRLSSVYRTLTAPDASDRKISAIVFASGFSDLSYFNRSFRHLYGASPSDVRARSSNQDDFG